MGTDIHSFAERRTDDGWQYVASDIFNQNYNLFGWLAGVRNGGKCAPIASRRGLPPNASGAMRKPMSSITKTNRL